MAQETRGGGPSNVIILPLKKNTLIAAAGVSAGPEPLLRGPFASVSPLPPIIVSVHTAMERLRRLLPNQVYPDTYLGLATPPRVKLATYPNGLEFYDLRTVRPEALHPGETMADIDSWVWHWYFSVIENSAKLIARYIDRVHPDPYRLRQLEAVIHDPSAYPGKYTLGRFIDKLQNMPIE